MRVAVSGVNGFVGGHLVADLVGAGHEVVGLGQGPAAAGVAPHLSDHVAQDLSVAWPRAGVVGVDAVVHLAGLSAVGPSFDAPQDYLQGNSAPVTHLGETALSAGVRPRMVVVSTGAVYAPGEGLDESAATQAASPYAVSKLLVETQCAYYRRRGLDVVVMRPFNHLGPRQQGGFLLPDLVAGVRSGALTVGDLGTRRDYTDVRDVARAYRLAVEAEVLDEPLLNICSGTSTSGEELLELVQRFHDGPPAEVTVDPARLRPTDPRVISGDASLAAKVLGWEPTIDLATTVRDTLAAD